MHIHPSRFIVAAVASFIIAAGSVSCSNTPTSPTQSAVVTFRVVNETFKVQLSGDALDAARRAQAGIGPKIPNGRIVAGTQVNTGWSWHLVDVEFADVTIEICDGRPSDVEKEGPAYAGGRYCPWGAVVTSIQ